MKCPDGGACHHNCKKPCWRRDEGGCVPLSGSGLNDDWTPKKLRGENLKLIKLRSCPLPSLKHLNECFHLNSEVGLLFWKERPSSHFKTLKVAQDLNRRYKDTPAGGLSANGYMRVTVQSKPVMVHRIVYALHHGVDPYPHEVLHRDGNRQNNRPDNLVLREAEIGE